MLTAATDRLPLLPDVAEVLRSVPGWHTVWLLVNWSGLLYECAACGHQQTMNRSDLLDRSPVQVVCAGCGAW